MFRTTPGIGTRVSDVRATAVGEPLPLDQLVASAQASATNVPANATVTVVLSREAGDPAHVRFQRAGGGRGGPPGEGGPGAGEGRGVAEGRGAAEGRGPAPPGGQTQDILIDPVSGQVLGLGASGMTPFMQFWHDLHGQMLVGIGMGRQLVGWLGVGMTFLALSGIYLWWPKVGQWKNAFIVRRNAKGFRFHRELHGAVGIWFVAVLFIVSFTGVAIVFPQQIRSGFSIAVSGGDAPAATPQRQAPRVPQVEPLPDSGSISADEAIRVVQQSESDIAIQSVTLPSNATQPYTVTVGAGRGSPRYVDPYRGALLETPAPVVQPTAQSPLDRLMGSMRQLHEGEGLGPVYTTLVFLSGFLPLIFVTTGFFMWLKKRQNKAAVKAA